MPTNQSTWCEEHKRPKFDGVCPGCDDDIRRIDSLESALRELVEAVKKCDGDVQASAADLIDAFGLNWIRNNILRDLQQLEEPLAKARAALGEGGEG